MEYVFGTKGRIEVLRTKSASHTELTGYQQTVSGSETQTVTDSFRVVCKIDSQEDVAGNCYDWYEIDQHIREIDNTPAVLVGIDRNAAKIDYVAMMAGVYLPEIGGETNGQEL